jgi:hypothetical protein
VNIALHQNDPLTQVIVIDLMMLTQQKSQFEGTAITWPRRDMNMIVGIVLGKFLGYSLPACHSISDLS